MMMDCGGQGLTEAPAYEDLVSRHLPLCRAIPKVELHAHLNGSIRSSTLLDLAWEHEKTGTVSYSEMEAIIRKERRSLTETFKLFGLIRLVTTDHDVITRITREVIEDFAAENVIYVELRTTPKNNPVVGMTKRSYMEAVKAGLDLAVPASAIHVRLIPSIDRRETTIAAMDTVRLACELRQEGWEIAGIDLSGDPAIGEWNNFVPALRFAREQGFPLALHCGEVPNAEEIRSMLAMNPERLGHVCCLDDTEWQVLLASGIPVEIERTETFISSFILRRQQAARFGGGLPYLQCGNEDRDIHWRPSSRTVGLYKARHPIAICTDDTGIFATSLSRELALAASILELTSEELVAVAKEAISFAFAEPLLKQNLYQTFSSRMSVVSADSSF